jgi:nucleotide-binding universal stress UspA family protein
MEALKLPHIRKILFPTDLSTNSRHAFSHAVSLANKYGAGITVLHVLEDPDVFAYNMPGLYLGEDKWREIKQENEERVLQMLKQRIQDFCMEVSSEIPECPYITEEVVLKVGNPVDSIVREVQEKGYDLVVMGARGHGILADVTLGSVSRRVLRRCKAPVMVVRLPEEE